jgi:hypothetical protein
MAQTPSKEEQFWKQLDALGEAEVRLKLASGFYGGPQNYDRRPLAEEWLWRKDQERLDARNSAIDAINSEQLRIARHTNIIAMVTLIAAIISIIVPIIISVLSGGK